MSMSLFDSKTTVSTHITIQAVSSIVKLILKGKYIHLRKTRILRLRIVRSIIQLLCRACMYTCMHTCPHSSSSFVFLFVAGTMGNYSSV